MGKELLAGFFALVFIATVGLAAAQQPSTSENKDKNAQEKTVDKAKEVGREAADKSKDAGNKAEKSAKKVSKKAKSAGQGATEITRDVGSGVADNAESAKDKKVNTTKAVGEKTSQLRQQKRVSLRSVKRLEMSRSRQLRELMWQAKVLRKLATGSQGHSKKSSSSGLCPTSAEANSP